MKLVFIRHSKVDFKWSMFYDSKAFDLACKEYDRAAVLSRVKTDVVSDIYYVSTLSRTHETLKAFIKDGNTHQTCFLDEVPLLSFTDTKIRFPLLVWMITGRLQWYFNLRRQPETRTMTHLRVSKFLDHAESLGQDCVIVGHGMYFSQLVKELQRRGATGDMRKRIRNDEERIFILPRQCPTDLKRMEEIHLF